METGAQQETEGNRKVATDLTRWADPLSKGVAAIAIVVYACGFLIVSLHHSKFGFIGTSPFRPRILAAGGWFLFFLAIPIAVATKYRDLSWGKIASNLIWFWSTLYGLSFPFSWLVFTQEHPPSEDIAHSAWWRIMVIGAAALIVGMLILVIRMLQRAHPIPVAVVSVVFVLWFTLFEASPMFNHKFYLGSVGLWFFGVFLLTIALFKLLSWMNLAEGGEWSRPLWAMFFALLLFAQYYYPHIKASWGGGAPVNVTVYFTKESPISPNKAVSAQLIEESDEGFYIVGPNETRAIYVPRSAVALVYFSDKIADSQLLRENK